MFLATDFVFSLFVPFCWAIDQRDSHKAHPGEQGLPFSEFCVWVGRGPHHTQDTAESLGLPRNDPESLTGAVLGHHCAFCHQPLPDLLLGFLNDSSFLFSEKKKKVTLIVLVSLSTPWEPPTCPKGIPASELERRGSF